MDRETAKQTLVDYGWDAAERRRIAEVLRFVEQDAECQQAAIAYDRLRAALRSDEVGAQPTGGWQAFATRMGQAARRRRLRTWLWLPAAAAAVIVAAIGGYAWRTTGTSQFVQRGTEQGMKPAFAAHEVRDSVAVFKQIAELFDQRASWVLVGDHASDMGLGRDPAQAEDRVVVLRLVLSKGSQIVSSGFAAERRRGCGRAAERWAAHALSHRHGRAAAGATFDLG